ncbi:hypothetical protein ACH5RR_023916 [Cinchona calisaya]|uniref:NAD-dependent epimerase/dehydratase domain-containing protein n=1 Tax=Cinchona calisaya TaxID=153742 RepID=A0ABD2ZDF0_9GENT
MEEGDKIEKGRVCVTGGTGFFASWLIKRLLEDGFSVNATIRSNEEHKYFTELSGASERLTIFEADLDKPDSFDAAIQGCTGVFHVAYPIAIEYAEKHGLDFVSIIPTWIHGPFVCPFLPGSVSASMAMIIGHQDEYSFKYLWRTPFVHTDDLARAHIFLFESPEAKGRYICNAVEITIDKLAECLSATYPEYPIPTTAE